MSDLPGPEKPIDWGTLTAASVSPATPTKTVMAVKKVRPRHRIVVMLSEAGHTNEQICQMTGYTRARVSTILNSQNKELLELRAGFASRVADHITDTNMRFKLYANEMLDVMVSHARDKEHRETSRLAARDILQMAGFTPIKRELQLRSNIPVEELRRVVDKLSEANEVAARYGEWEVKNLPAKAGAA